MSGADFLLDGVTSKAEKKTAAKIRNSGELDIDAAVALMDAKKGGTALRDGLGKAVSALEELKKTGLTGECLVVLVANKCGKDAAGRPTTEVMVQRVLEGLFRLREYVR